MELSTVALFFVASLFCLLVAYLTDKRVGGLLFVGNSLGLFGEVLIDDTVYMVSAFIIFSCSVVLFFGLFFSDHLGKSGGFKPLDRCGGG